MPVSIQKPRVVFGAFVLLFRVHFVFLFFRVPDAERQFRASSLKCEDTGRSTH